MAGRKNPRCSQMTNNRALNPAAAAPPPIEKADKNDVLSSFLDSSSASSPATNSKQDQQSYYVDSAACQDGVVVDGGADVTVDFRQVAVAAASTGTDNKDGKLVENGGKARRRRRSAAAAKDEPGAGTAQLAEDDGDVVGGEDLVSEEDGGGGGPGGKQSSSGNGLFILETGETKRSLKARLKEALKRREELRQLIGRLASERDQYFDRSRMAEDELESMKNDLDTYRKIVSIFREKRKEYVVFKRGVAVALGSVRTRVDDAIGALTGPNKTAEERVPAALKILDQLMQTVKNIDDRCLQFDPMSPILE